VFHVNGTRLSKILSCTRKPGVTSIFIFAPGIADNTISIENMEKLTGIKLALESVEQVIRVQTSGGSGLGAGVYGPEAKLSPLVYSVDNGADVLGVVEGLARSGLVKKQVGDASSLFSSAPCIPADILRNLFEQSGCRVFANDGEIVYANKSFISVCGLPQKKIVLNLSDDAVVFDLFSGTEINIVNGLVELPETETGVWIFFRGSREQWKNTSDEG
jgi:PAS domain-containing protein